MSHSKNIIEKIFAKKLLLAFFAFLFLLSNTGIAFAQNSAASNPNQQIIDYKDGSPGVIGQLRITTESMSADSGNILITGNLKYEFPPQPKSITFTVKNIDGKGTFKDFTISGTSSTPDNISILLTNVPLDKSSKTKTLATKDRFLITSKVDRGTDFFFAGNSTYLSFTTFSVLPQKTVQPPDNLSFPVPVVSGKSFTQSIIVTASKLISAGTSKTKATASVDFAALTLLPSNHYGPIYVGLARINNDNVIDYTVGEWREIQDPDAPRPDGMVLGASTHTFTVEKGTTYLVRAWGDTKSTTTPDQGENLGTFSINSDYLFGKKVIAATPGLQPINQSKIDDIWNSITGTFNPGDIEFFKIGSNSGLDKTDREEAYIFLADIPGLANTKVTREVDVTQPDGSTKKQMVDFPAFDPTIQGSFSKYISTFINMIYGFIALVAVINIIRYGLDLMVRSAVPSAKKENKEMIWNSFIALGIALGSYLLLNTINPNLTTWGIGLNRVEVAGEALKAIQISDSSKERMLEQDAAEEKLTPGSTKVFKKTVYYNRIKLAVSSSKTGIHHCFMQVAIQRESRGKPGLIGHDENVRSSGIPSRRAFIDSKITFKKNPIVGSILDKSAKNDDTLDLSAPDLGLDWRFSHSIGMFGTTFFPKGSKYADYSKGLYIPSLKKNVYPLDIYTNKEEADFIAYTWILKSHYDNCKGDVLGTFYSLGVNACRSDNEFIRVEAPLRADLYNQCVTCDATNSCK